MTATTDPTADPTPAEIIASADFTTIQTGRPDIVVTSGTDARPVRVTFVAQYGDSTGKALTTLEAIDLAQAILAAASR